MTVLTLPKLAANLACWILDRMQIHVVPAWLVKDISHEVSILDGSILLDGTVPGFTVSAPINVFGILYEISNDAGGFISICFSVDVHLRYALNVLCREFEAKRAIVFLIERHESSRPGPIRILLGLPVSQRGEDLTVSVVVFLIVQHFVNIVVVGRTTLILALLNARQRRDGVEYSQFHGV